jgi:hypothetical protein
MKSLAVVICGFIAGSASSTDQPPQQSTTTAGQESLGIDYTNWPSVMETPYPVAPDFYFRCAGPSPERLRAWEQEHGPHFKSWIVVKVNPVGIDQFKAGKPVPVGTVVVKEKYQNFSANARPEAIGVMIKHEPGYDPDHGDWEYAFEQFQPEQDRKMVRGKLENCIECHKGTRGTDYLFRPYLKAAR